MPWRGNAADGSRPTRVRGKPIRMVHENGTPRFEFMMAANNEYRARGGTDGMAIGTVAHALLRLLDA